MPLTSNASPDLAWLLVRDYNSQMVKSRLGGIKFLSSEKANVKNIHSPKYSGLSHPKPIIIQAGKDGKGLSITTRRSKAGLSSVSKSRNHTTLRSGSGPRRSAKIVSNASVNYRPDLRKAAIARASILSKAQTAPKEKRAYKPRSKKAARAAAKADEVEEPKRAKKPRVPPNNQANQGGAQAQAMEVDEEEDDDEPPPLVD